MKILLTGVTGFIGNYFASKWKNGHHKLIGIARSKVSPAPEIPIVYADLAENVPLEEPVDIIVHTAAQTRTLGICANTFVRSNVEAVRNLIQYARRFGVRKFIYLSTLGIYGKISCGLVDENTPIVDPDAYGLTKYLGELLLLDEAAWLSSVALRLPGVLGKASVTWLARVAEKIKKGKEVYVENPNSLFNTMIHLTGLERFILNLFDTEISGFEAVALGCKEPMTVRETVHYLRKHLNSTSTIQEKSCNQAPFTISIDKACRMGYRPMSARQILHMHSKEVKTS